MSKLEPKQSKLDYLWVNFGERGITSDSKDPDSIPSYGLIQELLDGLCSKAVGSVTKSGADIVIKSVNGIEQNRINISTLGDTTISNFGKRRVTEEDIKNGCPQPLNSWVYFIKLNNGEEYTAPTDIYVGGNGKVISNTILDNTIYSDLKISTDIKGVKFVKGDDGLQGLVYLENSTQGIHFSVVTQDQYDAMVHDATTLYFIDKQPYLYFGDTKMGGESISEINQIINRLNNIENLIDWENG